MNTRIEHDSLGDVEVPADALWRAQTQRAVDNFPISGRGVDPELIRAFGRIKAAAARVNAQLGVLYDGVASSIAAAATSLAEGEHADAFPVDVFQTGSGTSTNMNVNEVLASLTEKAGVAAHPNDHVNASQSSNDTFPTAIHVAAASAVTTRLIPALVHLAGALDRKAEEFSELVKAGRTHLMDATPVTLGQEFGGYAQVLRTGIERIDSTLPRVLELPLGGTAVGTGINTPAGFAAAVIADLREQTGLAFTEARDHFEAQGGQDALVELSGQLRTIAVGLIKICNDLRWMSSGPSAGLAEIHLPDLQPGSSIMPCKVNPVLPEATLMVCAQVIGNDAAVTYGGSAGSFELNVMMPVIARNLLESISLLANVVKLLADRCIAGITANPDRLRHFAESSAAIVTPLNRVLGYEKAAAIAKAAVANGISIRQAVIDGGYVERGEITDAQLDELLDVRKMTVRPE
ncbi:MAG: class II fumarate hydratase [Marmoricola sp.]